MDRRRCNPRHPTSPACRPPARPSVFRPGGVPGGGLFPFSNSAGRGPVVVPSPGPTRVPVNPNACHDTLTVVPFSVPGLAVVPVSGGGAALSAAVNAAAPTTILEIQDSLDYTSLLFNNKTNVTIRAAAGQTPTITAPPGNPMHCVRFANGNNGIALRGLTFIGQGNAGPPSPPGTAGQGLVNYNNSAGGLRNVIIEDCTFFEPDLTLSQGAPGIWFLGNLGAPNHQNIWVHRCTFVNVGMSLTSANTSGFGACTIGGFSNVYVQNCWVRRTTLVLSRNQSPMRGIVVRGANIHVEDVFCDDIGTGGQCENFLIPFGPSFGNLDGTVICRNCTSLNGRIGYGIQTANSILDVTNSVYYANTNGVCFTAVFLNLIGNLNYRNSVSFGAGDGNAFTVNPNGAPIVEDHNDILGFAQNGRPLAPSDLSVDPFFESFPEGDYLALNSLLQHAASDGGLIGIRYPGGEKILYCHPVIP